MILYDINVLEIYIRYLSLYLNICFFSICYIGSNYDTMITDDKYMICCHIGRVDTWQHVGEYVKEHQ